MSVLLVVRHGRELVGQCDATCYDAKHDDCVCCCGGAAHGIGLEAALEAVRDLAESHRQDSEAWELTCASSDALFPLTSEESR